MWREHGFLNQRFVNMKRAVAIVAILLPLAVALGGYVAQSDGSRKAPTLLLVIPPRPPRTQIHEAQIIRTWSDPPLRVGRASTEAIAPVESRSVALLSVDTLAHQPEPKALMRPVISRKMVSRSALRAVKAVRPARYVSLQTSRQQNRSKPFPNAPVQPVASEPALALVEAEPLEFSLASR